MAESAKPATKLQLGAFQRCARLGGVAVSKDHSPLESVSLAGPKRRLKSRMLGNPLVRFCEGQGGNLVMVLVTPSLRAPCLLDRSLSLPVPFFVYPRLGTLTRSNVALSIEAIDRGF